jgi:hypothetical protein
VGDDAEAVGRVKAALPPGDPGYTLTEPVADVLVQKQASPCLIGEMSIDEKPKRVSRDYDSRCGSPHE